MSDRFGTADHRSGPPGSPAFVSQSGQLGTEITGLGARAGLGVSRFCSVGNQLDVGAADVRESLVTDEHTTTVAPYLESFADGPRIVAALGTLRRAGKHALVLTTGAGEGSRRLARSHTGSMTSALDVVDAACRAVPPEPCGSRHRANSSTLQGCWTSSRRRTDTGSRSSATAAGRAGSPPTSQPPRGSARRCSPTGCKQVCAACPPPPRRCPIRWTSRGRGMRSPGLRPGRRVGGGLRRGRLDRPVGISRLLRRGLSEPRGGRVRSDRPSRPHEPHELDPNRWKQLIMVS
ncbi:hypothetical protein [Streptomyces sp. NPDC101455]|uniref:hypothetical protein n=1 Tax=Streptomyces sp. NPDC101455 TaxID=3366142 RepID=UPI0037FE8808